MRSARFVRGPRPASLAQPTLPEIPAWPVRAKSTAQYGTVLDYDTIIIGAGMSGLYQLYRLRELGLRVRVLEAGTNVGGTWYWNRYPGARFDSESYSYGYSFSKELLEEWDWSEHFAGQPETLRYLNHVTDKFDLRRDIQFKSRVTAASYDEDARSWGLTLEDGSRFRTRFLITAIGPLSTPTLPRIEGRDSFKGDSFHTARWPHEPVDFKGKRVAVIGTGATGVQTIQTIAGSVGHLTVFQRTPNWCAPLHNGKIDAETQKKIKAGYPEMFARCQETFACFLHTPDPRGAFEVSDEEREAFYEKLYSERGFGIWQGNFRDILIDRKANATISDFVARKIRQRVKNQAIAQKLIPKNHGFGTRRLPLETFYYEVYNQDNVELVDLTETPIERITPEGIKTSIAGIHRRHHHLCHRLRRHHRQFRQDRFPRRRWREAERQMEKRAADLSRHHGRRFSQHDDADGPAHRARQYSTQHRIQCRLGHGPRPLCAGQPFDAAGSNRRRRGIMDRPRQGARRRFIGQRGQFLDDRHQLQRRGQANPHRRPLQRQRPGLPRPLRRSRGEGI